MTTTAQLLTQNNGRVAALQASSNSTADTVPIASGGGKLDSWISDATTASPGKVTLATNGGTTPGTAVQANDDRLTGLVVYAGTTSLALYSGGGFEGNVTFDGTTNVTGFSLSSRVYTATSAKTWEIDTLTFDTTGGDIEIITKGIVIKAVSAVIVGSGTVTIHWDGSAASGISAGTGATALSEAPLLGGTSGGAGRSASSTGLAGVAQANGICVGGVGGTGGSGGNGSIVGGAGGTHTRDWEPGSRYGDTATLLQRLYATATGASTITPYALSGGSGGGSGGAGGGTNSGGGGGGGGCVAFFAGTMNSGTGTLIVSAPGGAGGNAVAVGNVSSGGGAGGAGGWVGCVFGYLTGNVTLSAVGGAGGNGSIAGTATSANGGQGGGGGVAACLVGGLASGTSLPTTNVAGGTGGTPAGTGTTTASVAGSAYVRQI